MLEVSCLAPIEQRCASRHQNTQLSLLTGSKFHSLYFCVLLYSLDGAYVDDCCCSYVIDVVSEVSYADYQLSHSISLEQPFFQFTAPRYLSKSSLTLAKICCRFFTSNIAICCVTPYLNNLPIFNLLFFIANYFICLCTHLIFFLSVLFCAIRSFKLAFEEIYVD